MSKRILMFCDGTWSTPETDTNVYKLFRACTTTFEQVAFYDDGLGTDGLDIWRLVGGAMGIGLWSKIKDGYLKIAHSWQRGDDVFVIGFSRGAYTARSIASMIAIVGLPEGEIDSDFIDVAFNGYRNKTTMPQKYKMFDAKIRMIGVFDTVGSLGLPAITGGVDPLLYGFVDETLHPDVLNAIQALALDEERSEFPPTLWKPSAVPVDGQLLEQVWFSGCHGDVGGGNLDHGLSDITLAWMARWMEGLGIEFNETFDIGLPDAKFALSKINESWKLFPWGWPKHRATPAGSSIANSVKIRCDETNYLPRGMTPGQVYNPKFVKVVKDPPVA